MIRSPIALLMLLCAATFAAEKPNIVFIFTDDLGIDDLSCYGREDQQTPHLDRLATEGMRFTSAYCSQPICSPSRVGVLTGKTPARVHLTTFLPGRADAPSQRLLQAKIVPHLPLEEKTIAELLKPEGYISACLGKWHLGGAGFGPKEQGFDFVHAGKANTKPSETEGGKGEYDLTARAVEFMEANQDRPFFLYLAHHTPHIPLGAKPALIEENQDAFNPINAAMMTTLDDTVGLLLAKLDALGIADRTMVIFTSDHGGLHVLEFVNSPATHNTPFRAGKGFVYEGGLRVPMIVRWPGKVAAGSLMRTPVILTDWVPTWLAMAGAPAEPGLDGVNILPLLTGGTMPARPFAWHFPHYTNQGSKPAGAFRDGDWKLVENYEDGGTELYHLASDPGERTNLAMENPDQAAALRGKLAQWRKDIGAVENEPNPAFDPNLARQLYEDVDVSTLEPAATAAEMAEQLAPWRATMNAVVKPDAITPAARPVIVLPARAAKIHGTKLRYEPEPPKNTLGFWTNQDDWAEWEFELPTAGEYAVEILQGFKGKDGAEVEFSVGGQTVVTTIEPTGHFQNFVPRTIGRVKLPAGQHTLTVKPKTKPGGAVMDLRQVVLLPPADDAKPADEAP